MIEQIGRYQLLEIVGEGGFAIVYKGLDTTLDRNVALKELRPILLQDTAWVERFRREARTIAKLDHPHIVPIYDVYENSDRLFIVMRLVEGNSLEGQINRLGALPWPTVVELGVAIANGLDYAHSHNVLHRDLKPANILLDTERGPLLTDFGLAKMLGQHSMSMTESGTVVGTPHYIAPEVWEGAGSSKQSDIYAIGCILYEMITGEKVIKGDTPPAVMMAHFKPLVLPNSWPEGVPQEVSTILQTALAQKPADRYATANDMAMALIDLAENVRVAPYTTNTMAAVVRKARGEADEEDEEPLGETEPQSPDVEQTDEPDTPQADVSDPDTLIPEAEPTPQPKPAAPTPVPHPHPDRGGCMRKGAKPGIAILLAIVIGVACFCAFLGRGVSTSINNTINSVTEFAANIETGQVYTSTIFAPVPEDFAVVSLDINPDIGKLRLTSGNTNALVEGVATFNVDQLQPDVTVTGRNVRIDHDTSKGTPLLLSALSFVRSDIDNVWDLEMGNVPTELIINAGTAESQIELGKVSLVDVSISQGITSNFDMTFTEPNQINMESFEFNSTVTNKATLTGLANTRASNMHFSVGAHDYVLEFTGELQNDIDVLIEGGLSSVTIVVPEGTAAQVDVGQSNDVTVDASSAWQKTGHNYTLPGQEYSISITVQADTGTLKLRSR